MLDLAAARRLMVDNQLRTFDVTDRRILAAMLETPREDHLPDAVRDFAYLDRPLPIGEGREALAPMLLARMLQFAEIGAQDKALCVGCGSGYGAAVLARLAGSVVALDKDDAFVTQTAAAARRAGLTTIDAVAGPLASGWPSRAPYDVIVMEGAYDEEPARLLEQLAEGGRLIGVAAGTPGRVTLFRRTGDVSSGRHVFDAAAATLPGFERTPGFVF